jgi:hypothetical protein
LLDDEKLQAEDVLNDNTTSLNVEDVLNDNTTNLDVQMNIDDTNEAKLSQDEGYQKEC